MNASGSAFLRCSLFTLASLAAILPAAAAAAGGSSSVGAGVGRVAQVFGDLSGGQTMYAEHCDGTFEDGYAWYSEGTGEPYYGAFAERYDVGPCEVVGIRLYLTSIGYYDPANSEDLFVWDRGVGGAPGDVLGMVPAVEVDPPALWPEVSAQDFAISATAGATFYIGGQANWPPCSHIYWFNAVDLDGPVGDPWTCVLPGGPHPEGWQHTNVVWEDNASSLGIGVYYQSGTSSVSGGRPQRELSTWGRVKRLFGER
jgi:hypothetical protein